MVHVYEAEQWVAAPLETVFRFFSDPRNLSVISPPSSGAKLKSLRLISPTLPGITGAERMAAAGSEIQVSFRLLPYFPVRGSWTARIIDFEWLGHFRDIQVAGPFKQFDHTHSFSAEVRNAVAGTEIRDRVLYDVGFGFAGEIGNALMVRAMLSQMFTYRHSATERLFSG
jgi:ligand-binding SRPBCC domain-containing protein